MISAIIQCFDTSSINTSIVAIRHESGSWRWALFTACFTTVLAWLVSAAVYQLGSLFVNVN